MAGGGFRKLTFVVSTVKKVSVYSTFLEGIFVRRGAKAVIVLVGSEEEGAEWSS